MATINKTIRYDLTAGDHLTGPMTAAAKAMDIASRNARALDRALASQRKAADVSAGASLALAQADKILAEAEDELSGKAAIARRELERQGAAAAEAARKQEAAAGRMKKLKSFLGTAGAGGGLFAAGAAGLAAAGPLGAAGAAIGAFGAIAIPELSKVHDALGKTGKAGQQAWAQLTPPEQQLGGAVRTVQASFGKLSATLAPVVDSVATLAAKTLTDLMPALGTLASAGGRVLTAFLKPLDAFAKSKAFSQIVGQLASFAVQAGKLVGPAVIQLVSELLTLFVKVMPAGIKILGALLPLISLLVTDLTPVIVAVANIVAATLQWLSKTHLLIPVIAALGAAVLVAVIAIEGVSAPIWLIIAAIAALVVGIVELVKHWHVVWHAILVVVMGVWDWIKRNWPLLLVILTGPIGLAILWVTRNFGKITDAVKVVLGAVSRVWNGVWNTLKGAFRLFIVNGILTPLGWIIHAAAAAFGWIPGIGGKLKTAARQFDQFKASVNKALGGLNNRTISVQVRLNSGQALPGITRGIPAGVRKASGGRITGPGGPTDDRAGLYALSNNEWVIRADSAARYGHAAMAAVNEGRAYIGYAGGGGVGVTASAPGYKTIEASLLASVTKLAKAFAKAAAAMGSVGGHVNYKPGAGVGQWRGVVLQALRMLGLSPNLVLDVLYQMLTESGGRPDAVNRSDINWQLGHPSVGLMQVIHGTYAAYGAPRFGYPAPVAYGVSENPLANVYAALNYGKHGRGFGTGPGQIGSGHGYALGTTSARPGWAWVGERGRELVRFRGGEQVIPHHRAGSGSTYNITVNVPPNANLAHVGRVTVDAIRAYESGSGTGWRTGRDTVTGAKVRGI